MQKTWSEEPCQPMKLSVACNIDVGPLSSWGRTRVGSKIPATYPGVVGRIMRCFGEEEEHGSEEECGQASPTIQFLPHTWGFPTSSAGEESRPWFDSWVLEDLLEKGSWKKGSSKKDSWKQGRRLRHSGRGGAARLLHRGQHSCSAGSSGQKGLCFYFTGTTRVDSPPLRSGKNRVRGSGVKGWQDLKDQMLLSLSPSCVRVRVCWPRLGLGPTFFRAPPSRGKERVGCTEGIALAYIYTAACKADG